ncbi:MAG TPA: TIGR03084 family metal-binding protein [Micromonosporaceae bacterium]
MPVDMTTLAEDVAAETTALRLMIAGLDESGWRQDTPAAGWTVADQVGHLAYFDDAAITSATDPDEFAADLERAVADDATSADAIVDRYRVLPPAELLVWFDESRARLLDVFRSLDPSVRLPWFGPPMSAASALTARLMETWAHGQDIADALGVVRQPTDRLKHVAHIGVGARAFSFAAHGRSAPDAPVRVELAAPGGETWTWGPAGADDRVSGPALDFCLVVTQRRHLDDTALRIEGPAATEWMSIAQAFAGPPGPGRRPGQFA